MSNPSYKHLWQTKAVCFATLFTIFGGQLYGNPEGFQLVAGDAKPPVMDAPGSLVVKSGKNSVINWSSFSVDKKEKFRFEQASSKSSVLNRVTGKSQSSIFGQLESNGKIYLINPHGVLIGPGARIESAGFLAATSDIMNDDFLKGADLLFKDFGPGSVVNLGTIDCPTGDITLLARSVKNEGTLNSPNGVTSLATGTQILLKPSGSNRVFIQANLPEDANEEASLQQAGAIQALAVELKGGVSPYAKAIKSSGHIEATGVLTENGRIYLVAEGGRIDVSGTLSTKNETEKGGDIQVLGALINIEETAKIDASGATGGGKINIGGSFQGKDRSIIHAEKTLVQIGAEISSDGLQNGNGGDVVVWADGYTFFGGLATSRGGSESGDGGLIEISGKDQLDFHPTHGKVYTNANQGKSGTVLFDPENLYIVTPGSVLGVTTVAFTDAPAMGTSMFTPDSIINLMNMGNDVTLQAGTEIRVISSNTVAINGTGAGHTLTLNAGIDIRFISPGGAPTAPLILNLGAANFASTVNTAVPLNAGTRPVIPPAVAFFLMEDNTQLRTTSGNVTMNGSINPADPYNHANFSAGFSNEASEVHINGGQIITTSGNITITGVGAAHQSSPNPGISIGVEHQLPSGTANPTVNSILQTTTGNVTLNAFGGNLLLGGQVPTADTTGLLMDTAAVNFINPLAPPQNTNNTSSIVQTNSGAIDVTALGGFSTADNDVAVHLLGPFTSVTTTSGPITITGTGGGLEPTVVGSSEGNDGIRLYDGAQISSTGSGTVGAITLTGVGGGFTNTSAGSNMGVHLLADTNGTHTPAISVVDADLVITGTGGAGTGALALNVGVFLQGAGFVNSTGSGSITINGQGGTAVAGTFLNSGIALNATTPGDCAITSSGTGPISLTGTGSANSTSISNNGIRITSGGQVNSTGSAAATVTMHGTGGTGTSILSGIFLSNTGTQISSTTGAISLTGVANNTGTGSSNNGIAMDVSALITNDPGSMGTGTANITLHGTGGTSTTGAAGISMNGVSEIVAFNGSISMTGTAGVAPTSVLSTGTAGIFMTGASQVTSTGNATITMVGNGAPGNGTDLMDGIQVDALSFVSSATGAIDMTGTAGTNATGQNNNGISLSSGGQVISTSTAPITMRGTGGGTLVGGTTQNYGIFLGSSTADISRVTTVNGLVTMTGTGGKGASNQHVGIGLDARGRVISTGSGALNLTGTGGQGNQFCRGIHVGNNTAHITTSGTGPVHLIGHGLGLTAASTENVGIGIFSGIVESTGTSAATILMDGFGGLGTASAVGVVASGTVSSINGNITINGAGGATGGTSGAANHGVSIAGAVTSTGPATITITGTGSIGASTPSSGDGVIIAGAAGIVSSSQGLITVNGFGADLKLLAGDASGIKMQNGGTVSTTNAANIIFNGTGGTGAATSTPNGLFLGLFDMVTSPALAQITTVNGNITLTGTGGIVSGGIVGGKGVFMRDLFHVSSSGSGNILVNGTGGAGTTANYGINVNGAATRLVTVSVGTGNMTFNGQGTGSTTNNYGIYLQSNAVFTTAAASPNGITMTGTGGAGTNNNVGIFDADSTVTFNSTNVGNAGPIVLIGQGGGHSGLGGGTSNYGILMSGGATIAPTGAANITLTGTGGPETDSQGVVLSDPAATGATITSAGGNIVINGQGGTTGASGNNNYGVDFQPATTITAPGAATITVTGTGGIGVNSNNGVNFAGTAGVGNDVTITGANGLVAIQGTGGGDGTGTTNDGINFTSFVNISVTGPGGITLSGTGGNGTGDDKGLLMADTNSQITSSGNGPINLFGFGGFGTGSNKNGVEISGITVSTMTAPINITGTGGTGLQTSKGVVLSSTGGNGALVTSASGNITVEGRGGTGTGPLGVNTGVEVQAESQITSTGPATISLTGTGGSGGATNVGVYILSSDMMIPSISSTTSNITLVGIGGTGVSDEIGIKLQGPAMGMLTNTGIQSGSGTIRLTGTGGSTGTANTGILMAGDPGNLTQGGLVQTVSGPIFFTGTGGTGTANNSGIWIDNGSEVTSGSGNMTFVATSGANTNTAFLMDPGPIIQSSNGANISITSTNTNVDMEPNSLITFTAGAGTLTINSAQDFIMQGSDVAMNQPSSIILNTGNATITAARDALMTSGIMTGSAASITAIGAVQSIQMFAGRDIRMTTPTPGVTTTINGPVNVTLITDNSFPTAPGIGPGGFHLDANSTVVAGGQLRVYTARPTQNVISGTLNGAGFAAGTFGVDTAQEQFLTYFPAGTYGGNVFKIYYKVGGLPPPPPPPVPINPPLVLSKIGISLMPFNLPLSALSGMFRPQLCELPKKGQKGDDNKKIKCTPKVVY